jgi:hypothetical protein
MNLSIFAMSAMSLPPNSTGPSGSTQIEPRLNRVDCGFPLEPFELAAS